MPFRYSFVKIRVNSWLKKNTVAIRIDEENSSG